MQIRQLNQLTTVRHTIQKVVTLEEPRPLMSSERLLLILQARIEAGGNPASTAGAYLMGLAFGFGWTPCVGPALAAILFVASGQDELWRGGTLLLVYGLAMTLPFVLAALFARPFLDWVGRHRRKLAAVERVMGVMLILFAVLIATDSVNRIAAVMIDNFDWSATLK